MRLVSRDQDMLRVHGGMDPPYISPGAQSAGMVRYNASTQGLEVYDGQNWLRLDSYAELELNPEIRETVEWARRKQQEEQDLEMLCARHPGLQDAWDRFRLMRELVKQESHK